MKRVSLLCFPFVWVTGLWAQQSNTEPQRITLAGLRVFAAHARVQATGQATLQRPDAAHLQAMVEQAMRREGLTVQDTDDVRDGSGAQVSLQYLITPIRDGAGQEAGFAASSCIHVYQNVRIPRFNMAGRITYSVAPTWSNCGIMVGDNDSSRVKILRNADEQITRFLQAWRTVNRRQMPEPRALVSPPGLRVAGSSPLRSTSRTSAGTRPGHRDAAEDFGA